MLFNGSAFEGKDDDGGTDTGRTSAVDPAVQTIPKHNKWAKRLRKCYPSPPGYRFFQADFSQGELRLAACAANEPNMLDAYKAGKDLHCVTGSSLAGYELPTSLRGTGRGRSRRTSDCCMGWGPKGFTSLPG
jgi:DNA polymerase I-like protein with 3'-5' exonuclease and polymerase domains